jgi:hypothetical protein
MRTEKRRGSFPSYTSNEMKDDLGTKGRAPLPPEAPDPIPGTGSKLLLNCVSESDPQREPDGLSGSVAKDGASDTPLGKLPHMRFKGWILVFNGTRASNEALQRKNTADASDGFCVCNDTLEGRRNAMLRALIKRSRRVLISSRRLFENWDGRCHGSRL